jgi:hypothetical protein
MLFQAFLGGLSCKLYDDLNDNIVLKKFYNTTFMEYLKGIHYISLISVSIDDPLFFIIFYIGCFLNHLRDGDAFKEPYEHSLLYSFILLFIILDYTKITNDVGLTDIIIFSVFLFSMFIEKVVMHYFVQDSEFSTSKLIIRMLALICVVLSFLLCKSKSTKHLFTYLTGYVILSILIQYYSLLKTNNAKSAVDDVNDAVDNGAKLASQNSKKKLRIKRKKKLEEENKQLRNS